ncbi:S8 family serine peptidase [Candidatus Omnitrophota bacterium]
MKRIGLAKMICFAVILCLAVNNQLNASQNDKMQADTKMLLDIEGSETADAVNGRISSEQLGAASNIPKYSPDQLLIKFSKTSGITTHASAETTLDRIQQKDSSLTNYRRVKPMFSLEKNHSIKEDLGMDRWFVVSLAESTDIKKEIAKYLLMQEIEQVEPNYYYTLFGRFIPNDPYFYMNEDVNQWHFDQSWNRDIDAPEAWDISRGSSDVVIAVIDSGVKYDHIDLGNNIAEEYGYDFVDLDGWNRLFCASDEDCEDEDDNVADVHGHGTCTAGIVGASTDNGYGVAGTCHNCTVLPLRAAWKKTNGNGAALTEDIVAAIMYAVDHSVVPADVISMSLGGYNSDGFETAIEYANSQGVIMIAAAGNDDVSDETYPAAFDEVIGVAATSGIDLKSYYSNYGYWVDIAAPGGDPTYDMGIWTTTITGGYGTKYGTSMSAPIVAGVAGLLISHDPSLNYDQIRTALLNGFDPIADTGEYIGRGRISAEKVLSFQNIPAMNAEIDDLDPSFEQRIINRNDGIIEIIGNAYSDQSFSYSLHYKFASGDFIPIGGGSSNVVDDTLAYWDVSALVSGEYLLKLEVTSGEYSLLDYHEVQIMGSQLVSPIRSLSPIVVGDIDPTYPGLEFTYVGMTAGYDKLLYAYYADGTLLNGFPIDYGIAGAAAANTPTLIDLDDDGYLEILFSPLNSFHMYAYNHDGTDVSGGGYLWPAHFYTGDWTQAYTASALDINNDGETEIIWGTMGQDAYVYDRFGNFISTIPTYRAHPAFGDVDSDGDIEVITAEETGEVATLTIFGPDGTNEQTWTVDCPGVGADGHRNILVGDYDPESPEMEILGIGRDLSANTVRIFMWRDDGSEVSSRLFSGTVASSGIVVANAIDDGTPSGSAPEIFVKVADEVHVFDGDFIDYSGWPVTVNGCSLAEPIIADVIGDNVAEVILGCSNGTTYIYDMSGTLVFEEPNQAIYDPPTVADLDQDGKTEIVFSSEAGVFFFDMESDFNPSVVYWPHYMHDIQHSTYFKAQCADDVYVHQCLDDQPKYCSSTGIIIDNCQTCLCSGASTCNEISGMCMSPGGTKYHPMEAPLF